MHLLVDKKSNSKLLLRVNSLTIWKTISVKYKTNVFNEFDTIFTNKFYLTRFFTHMYFFFTTQLQNIQLNLYRHIIKLT